MSDLLKLSIQDLGKLKTDKLAEAEAITKKAEAEARDLTEAEDLEINQAFEQAEAADKIIKARNGAQNRYAKLNSLRGDTSTAPVTRTSATVEVGEPRWMADPAKGFKDPTDFFTSVMQASITNKAPENLQYLNAVGSDEHSTSNDQYGGYTIPEAFRTDLLAMTPEADPISPLVTDIPMSVPTIHLPALVDKNHSTSVTGGLRVYRNAEMDDVPSSRFQMERITLSVNDIMGVSYATANLLTDSPISFAALFAQSFGRELVSKLIDERISGTGVGQFEGILNNPALITVAKETGQGAGTVVLKNVAKIYARQYNKNNAIWLANHDVLPALMELNQNVGTGGVPAWQPSLREGAPNLLMGRPIYFHEAIPSNGSAGDLMFVDWSQYLQGSLGGSTFAESIHVRFLQNESCFRFTARNDGRLAWRSVLTPKNGATLSPVVVLGARA